MKEYLNLLSMGLMKTGISWPKMSLLWRNMPDISI